MQRGLCELGAPSPEKDEEGPPYPPAKRGDKGRALARDAQGQLPGGWPPGGILPTLAPSFFLEETGCWQR